MKNNFGGVILVLVMLPGLAQAQVASDAISNERHRYEEEIRMQGELQSLQIELDKQKILKELNQLRRENRGGAIGTLDWQGSAGQGEIRLVFIAYHENFKQVVIKLAEKHFIASEGQNLWDGYVVSEIRKDTVILKRDGEGQLELTINDFES